MTARVCMFVGGPRHGELVEHEGHYYSLAIVDSEIPWYEDPPRPIQWHEHGSTIRAHQFGYYVTFVAVLLMHPLIRRDFWLLVPEDELNKSEEVREFQRKAVSPLKEDGGLREYQAGDAASAFAFRFLVEETARRAMESKK